MFSDVEHGHDVGMHGQACSQVRFALEATAHFCVLRMALRQQLDRDESSEVLVRCPVHVSHAAARNGRDKHIALGQHGLEKDPAMVALYPESSKRSAEDHVRERGVPIGVVGHARQRPRRLVKEEPTDRVHRS